MHLIQLYDNVTFKNALILPVTQLYFYKIYIMDYFFF